METERRQRQRAAAAPARITTSRPAARRYPADLPVSRLAIAIIILLLVE